MDVRNGTPTLIPKKRPRAQRQRNVLDAALIELSGNPSASLGEVASAASIGRTTLHARYPTRQDLLVAVAHRALGQAEHAIEQATAEEKPAAALERLVRELIPVGAGLVFLVRQPTLDEEPEVVERMNALEPRIIALVERGKRAGVVRSDLPNWWFASTLYAQVYVAWEAVELGRLALLDAPKMTLETLVHGLGGDHVDDEDST